MLENWKPSDLVTVLGKLDPVSQGAGTVATGYVNAGLFAQLLAELDVGALGASATVDAKLQQATDGSGTGVKDITGAAITQLTKAGTDDNKLVLINLDCNKLDVAGGFNYVRLSVTVGTAACLIAARLYGLGARFEPGAHIATVDEVVNVA